MSGDVLEHRLDDEEKRLGACSGDATCATGGTTHCRMYTKYPWLADPDVGDGCCVRGCFLDALKD